MACSSQTSGDTTIPLMPSIALSELSVPLPTATILMPPTIENTIRPTTTSIVARFNDIATPTLRPTNTPTKIPTPTMTKTMVPTIPATATTNPSLLLSLPLCDERLPLDDLLTIITRQYPVSSDYVPADLVPLSNYFPYYVTVGYDTYIRQEVVEPLQNMINDMYKIDGLAPTILSGYRSYYSQVLARQKWEREYPDRADQLSAPPGTSEHQLGTTVDFGSPMLNNKFHTNFSRTPEGKWLSEHAHTYGFTLSYPMGSFAVTRFDYEPWHFRYVGADLATWLHNTGTTFTEHQLSVMPIPCRPS